MAVFTIGEALGDFANLATVVDVATLAPVSGSATELVLADGLGNRLSFSGTGLTYEGEGASLVVRGGTFTGFAATDDADQPLLDITDMAINARTFGSVFGSFGFLAAYLFLTDGNDTFNGSSNSDVLLAGAGRDRVKGEAGLDYIDGGKGSDKLWGGRGADTFFFEKSSGRDTILDFTDTGGSADDLIQMSRAMYRTMETVQEAEGVRLILGKAQVLVQGWTLEQVDQGDFVLF